MKNIVNIFAFFILFLLLFCISCHKQKTQNITKENNEIISNVKPFIKDNEKITVDEYEKIKEYLPPLIQGTKVDDDWYLYEISFENSDIPFYQEFYNTYGKLFLKYKKKDIFFVNYGNLYFPITEVLFFYKEAEEYNLLGKKDIEGIYNNKDELILECPKSDFIVGYSSKDLFVDPFSNYLCLEKDDLTIYPADSFGNINIDYSTNTITATPMSEIKGEALRE